MNDIHALLKNVLDNIDYINKDLNGIKSALLLRGLDDNAKAMIKNHNQYKWGGLWNALYNDFKGDVPSHFRGGRKTTYKEGAKAAFGHFAKVIGNTKSYKSSKNQDNQLKDAGKGVFKAINESFNGFDNADLDDFLPPPSDPRIFASRLVNALRRIVGELNQLRTPVPAGIEQVLNEFESKLFAVPNRNDTTKSLGMYYLKALAAAEDANKLKAMVFEMRGNVKEKINSLSAEEKTPPKPVDMGAVEKLLNDLTVKYDAKIKEMQKMGTRAGQKAVGEVEVMKTQIASAYKAKQAGTINEAQNMELTNAAEGVKKGKTGQDAVVLGAIALAFNLLG